MWLPAAVGRLFMWGQPAKQIFFHPRLASSLLRRMASTNRLTNERSPYLLQHASNPVDWHPWGEEAFRLAREQNKPIFLSVGYSTCHWCHVMERESFENADIAAVMNEHFVNVKVDREERPDVDKVYMTFVQASSGGGGWPMSVFLTPDLKPFFGGTYFPPADHMSGRPGFKTLLRAIAGQWASKREDLVLTGQKIIEALDEAKAKAAASADSAPETFSSAAAENSIKKCFRQLLQSYDPEQGGFSSAPKFPQPVNLNFLFRLYARSPGEDQSKQALKMCLHSLEMMSRGGIHDHVSKGFARYSTDAKWHVPHFEKMLYDQGQLLVSYAQAYQATKERKFAQVAEDIVEYVCRDLLHPLGGFYSAEDADSLPHGEEEGGHKKEGAFCVWTHEEVRRLLADDVGGSRAADVFCAYYNVREAGNVDPGGDPHGELKGQNVLTWLSTNTDGLMQEFGIKDEAELSEILESCRKVLYEQRQKRLRPHLDDKIITAWNGLMVSGLCAAGAALQKPEFVETAVRAADFVREHLYREEDKTLLRSVYSGGDRVEQIDSPIAGFVDDYAFFIRALLDLYEVTFQPHWLEWAAELQARQDELFWDGAGGGAGYFTSAAGDASIVLRLKDDQDGAEPASNSVSALNLLRLAAFLDRPACKEKAERIFAGFAERLEKIPVALPEMAGALMLWQSAPVQIVVTGGREDCGRMGGSADDVARDMIRLVQTSLLPAKVLMLADGDRESVLYRNQKVLTDLPADGKPGTAYVCKDFACSRPITTVEQLKNELNI